VSFRIQIALFGAAVVGITLLVFSVLVYGLAARGLGPSQDRDLIQRAQRVEAFLGAAGPESFTQQHVVAPADLSDSNDTFVELLDTNGSPLSSTAVFNGAPPQLPAEFLATAGTQGSLLSTLALEPDLAVRVYVRPWARPDLGASGYVVVGQTARGAQATQAGIRGFLWLSGVVTFVAALIAVWLVAGRALRPLFLVASTAEDIRITGDLGRRLPESRGWTELNRVARAFNGMLERLDDAQGRLASALEAQRRFVADASHELRTPLTTIRTNAGLLLRRTDVSANDRQAALQDIADESERMSRLVHDLLVLARADAGQHLERTPLDLAPLVQDVGRQAQQIYPAHQITVNACTAQVVGNIDGLKQLLWILVGNAARFSPAGGCVRLGLRVLDDVAELRVDDDGPGIPPADLGRIFDRFYQADSSRAASGAGLGLSIARWIVNEHGGRITAVNSEDRPGAVFVATLPLAVRSDRDRADA
jgi:two-component system, OmpR family, sensor kinase